MAVVYDRRARFVTGGGWIDSPAGAYTAGPALVGKATFGFVSRYQKGANVPAGTTVFQFDLAGLAFSSTSYEWLVVNQAGMNAQFKGAGLVNGAFDPNGHAYKFTLWAGDGSQDTFRIRILWENTAGEHDVYDNGVNQAIGAGNIVVHAGRFLYFLLSRTRGPAPSLHRRPYAQQHKPSRQPGEQVHNPDRVGQASPGSIRHNLAEGNME